MDVIPTVTIERITGSVTVDPDGNLLLEMIIWGERKTVKLDRNKTGFPNFYKSRDRLVYIRIPSGHQHVNRVRMAEVAIQKVDEDYYLLCAYNVRNTYANIVSWVDTERGRQLKSMEAIDSFPIAIPAVDDK